MSSKTSSISCLNDEETTSAPPSSDEARLRALVTEYTTASASRNIGHWSPTPNVLSTISLELRSCVIRAIALISKTSIVGFDGVSSNTQAGCDCLPIASSHDARENGSSTQKRSMSPLRSNNSKRWCVPPYTYGEATTLLPLPT